jgi:hypothetical protein
MNGENGEASILEYARDDLKCLLDRGYRKDSALGFVADHHHLDAKARNRLMRETYSNDEISDTESKITPIEEIKGKDLVIDGFNVLITVETGFSGGELFLSMDGIVRDNTMAFANYKIRDETAAAADEVVKVLAQYRPLEATWVFDSQISGSGRLAEYVRKAMATAGVRGKCMTAPDADGQILRLNTLTATSDTPMIRRLAAIVDLPQAVFSLLDQNIESEERAGRR